MMNQRAARRIPRLATGLLVAGLAGCIDDLVKVEERDIIPPDQVNTAAGAAALYAGAIRAFGAAVDGDNGGTEGQILVAGQMADEWFNGDTFNTRQDYDQRATDLNNGTLALVFRALQDSRLAAKRAIAAISNTSTDLPNDARIGAMQNRVGGAYLFAGMNYCSGVPFSEIVDGTIEYGQPLTTTQILAEAVSWFDKALAGPAGPASVNHNTARLLKARTLMLQGTGQFAAAAALVGTIPTTFRAVNEHSIANGGNENGVFVFNHLSRRWTMSHREGGNGLPFRGTDGTTNTLADPRLPWRRDGIAFDNLSPLYLWLGSGGRDTPIAFAKGEEARLIEAEAALQAGDVTTFLDKLNQLRTTVAGLTPLTDPGTAAGRQDLLFSERGFWLFSTGTRLSDLRRLVRQYGRAATSVFPTGAYPKGGGQFGTDVNLPVPTVENQNPNFVACIDRNA